MTSDEMQQHKGIKQQKSKNLTHNTHTLIKDIDKNYHICETKEEENLQKRRKKHIL